jgi:threonine synthase
MTWLDGSLPRFFAVQAEGCAPVVKAFHDKADTTTPWDNPTTHAAGLRVPSPFAGRQMLKILRESGGGAVAVGEAEIQEAQRLIARVEGIWTAPESAALVAALQRLRDERVVTRDAEIVLVFTGAGIKNDPPPLPPPVDLEGSDAGIVEQVRRTVAKS